MIFKFLPLFIFLLYVGCINKIEYINSSFSDKKITDFGVDVEISYYLKGQLEFQLIAPEIEQITDPIKQNIFSQGISVYIYNSSLLSNHAYFFILYTQSIKTIYNTLAYIVFVE